MRQVCLLLALASWLGAVLGEVPRLVTIVTLDLGHVSLSVRRAVTPAISTTVLAAATTVLLLAAAKI